MPARILLLITVLSLLGAARARAAESSIQTVNICDGLAEWPPFSYFERTAGRKTGEVVGFSVEVIRQVLGEHEIVFTIDKTAPWIECVEKVEDGSEYQMLLNAARTDQRERTLYISDAYYSLELSYFYSRDRFPSGLTIENASDLNELRLCGIAGYNYAYEGLDASRVDKRTFSYSGLIERLKSRQCDAFLESYETLRGLASIGSDVLTGSGLAWAPVPGVPPDSYHIMISRNFSQGQELLEIVNQGLRRLKASGSLSSLD